MTEARAVAIALANLKTPGAKDLFEAALALEYLRKAYGKTALVAAKLGVSQEIVREFITLLRLPSEVRSMFEHRKLRTLEQGRRLVQLMASRPDIVVETAHALQDVSAHDSRAIVDYLLGRPASTPTEAKLLVEENRTVRTNQYHVVVLLTEDDFELATLLATQEGVSTNAFVTALVEETLAAQRDGATPDGSTP